MEINPYGREPLCVQRYDPATRRAVHAYYFLGGAPAAVLRAARRGGGDATLRGYYGPRWRALLGLERGGVARTYSEIAVYGEDTIMDLRLKVSLASGVALYRQHLFYEIGGETAVPYRVTVDGAPVAVDWRSLAAGAGAHRPVAGVAVDPLLEERRDALCVEALDALVRLSPAPGLRVDRAGFVDLYDVVAPLAGDERRPPDGLAAVLRDRYQLDLLYYGGLLRYWPQLSRAACALALTAPERVGAEHPDLDPEPAALAAWLAAEQAVVRRAHLWTPTGRRRTAVTAAALRLPPESARMRADVRNIFDGVACAADGVLAAAVRFGGAVAVKRHTTSYRGPAAAAVAAFAAAAPEGRPQAVVFACAAGGAAAAGARSLVSLAVHENGTHTAAATWRDDENVDFAAASREIAAAVAPLVSDINALGAAAFPIGGALSGALAQLSAVTASAYWPHAVSTAGFRDMKSGLRELERAGVIRIQGLQQLGAFIFTFVKGVVGGGGAARPPPRCENQYGRLTDEAAAARWLSARPGRTVRIHHRATDLRVEIEQADSLAEFEMIRRYVFSFLDAAPRAPERGAAADDASRRLRRLQERDPNLFDLKKYDPGLAVYSVLCQSRRQPHVYNAAEAARAPAARARAFTRYWNFTEGEPAFYECPDPEYPHLSLRAGQHPLGYCLPCCKKTRPAPGSRALQVNEACLAPYGDAPAREARPARAAAAARHTLTYGKAVPAGRTSELPAELRALFADAGAMAIEGVAQSTAAIPDAGFAFALERLLGAGALAELAALAGTLPAYYALGGGAAGHFAAAADLAGALLEAFVVRSAALTPFGPGGALADAWPAILTDLARLSRGVAVVRFVHGADGFAMSLAGPLPAGGRAALVLTGPAGTYPVAHAADADAAVAAAVRGALQWQAEQRGPAPAFDLDFVRAYAASPGATFGVDAQLLDMHDRCYGVMLRGAAGAAVYVPVHYSAAAEGVPRLYGPRPEDAPGAPHGAAVAEIDAYGVARGAAPMRGVEIVRGAEACGTRYELPTRAGAPAPLCFFHAPRPRAAAGPAFEFPYDSRAVDAAVVRAARARPQFASPAARAAERRNRLYQMFLIEFAAVQQRDRNAPLRAKLRAAVLETKFGRPESVAALRRRVFELVAPAGAQDLETVRGIVARAFAAAPLRAGELAAAAIDATAFDFDRRLLAALAALPADETAAAVRRVMAPHIEVGPSGAAALPNVIVPCAAGLRAAAAPQCAGARLLVPADRLDDLCAILAADIHNPGKRGLLSSVRAGTADPLRFIERPDEHLSISAGHV